MTALEQELLKELEQEKVLNINLIEKLEKQETNFLKFLQNQQTAYEKSLSQVVRNYQLTLQTIESDCKTYLEQNKKELESLRAEQGNLYKQMKSMNEILINLPSYESLDEGLKTLSNLQGN